MNPLVLIVGIASGGAHSIYSVLSKLLLRSRVAEPFLLFFYITVFQAILTPALWLFISPEIPPAEAWHPLLLSAATGWIAFVFLYWALSCGDVSSVMPILGSKVIFAGLLAAPLLQESHHWPVYLAALLVAVSIAMLGYSPSSAHRQRFPVKPILLMVGCCLAFALTDIYIKRTLPYIDSGNFMVAYNAILGLGSLAAVPFLRKRNVSLIPDVRSLALIAIASIALIAATLLFVMTLSIAEGVVIPNIVVSSRGVFVVLISAALSSRGSALLDTQSRTTYLVRFAASCLIVLSIWIALMA